MTFDVRLELQRKLISESSEQLPRLYSERKTTTSRLKRSSESRGIRLWRAQMGAVWAEGDNQRKHVGLDLRL